MEEEAAGEQGIEADRADEEPRLPQTMEIGRAMSFQVRPGWWEGRRCLLGIGIGSEGLMLRCVCVCFSFGKERCDEVKEESMILFFW